MESLFNHPGLFFALIFGAVAVDLFAGLTWWAGYFRFGVPLFVRRQTYFHETPMLPGSKALAERYSGTFVIPLLFHRLSPNEVAVRESFWGGFFRFTYTPLAHGLLTIDETSREMKIVAHANISPLVFLAVFAVPLTIRMGPTEHYFGVVILIILFGSILMIQYVRYGRVLKEALDLISGSNGNRA